MSARITRTRLLAACTVAFAALTMTACNSDDDKSAAASSAPASPSQPAAPTPTAAASATGATSGGAPSTGTPSTDKPAASGGNGGASTAPPKSTAKPTSPDPNTKVPQCDGSNTKTTATVVPRPLNHLLLTITNTGSKSCDLLNYPVARFGEAQAVPPVDETSKPQAVIRLAPGESGYAGVRLSASDGSGEGGYETKSLTLYFENGTNSTPSLATAVYVDSKLQVTYWQTTLDEALN